jgi:protein NrfD
MTVVDLVWLERGHWGLVTALYLFFAALGGGAYLTGVAAYGLGGDGERRERLALARWSFLVALAAVAVAGVAILSHLADPLAGLLFPLTLHNFGSWITRGTWILVALGAFTALQTLWLHFGSLGGERGEASGILRRIAGPLRPVLDRVADGSRPGGGRYWLVAGLGLLPALGTVYTGFELAAVATVPLWHHPVLLPGAFLVSGVAAGIAVALALTVAFEGTIGRFVVGYSGAVGLALLATGGLLWRLWESLGTSPAAAQTKADLASAALQTPFAVLFVCLAVSLVASPVLAWVGYARGDTTVTKWVIRPGLVATLLLGVVGTFLVRYVVIAAAVKEPFVVVGI